jgi:Amt family ammonium transporter
MAGAGMLWVGWFGFHGGSALAADGSAASAIIATHAAAAAGAATWITADWLTIGKAASIGIATGCIAGLATITPMAGFAPREQPSRSARSALPSALPRRST